MCVSVSVFVCVWVCVVYVCVGVWVNVHVCVCEWSDGVMCVYQTSHVLWACTWKGILTIIVYIIPFPYTDFCHIHKLILPKTSQLPENITRQLPISPYNKLYTMKTHIHSIELQNSVKKVSPTKDTHSLFIMQAFPRYVWKIQFWYHVIRSEALLGKLLLRSNI